MLDKIKFNTDSRLKKLRVTFQVGKNIESFLLLTKKCNFYIKVLSVNIVCLVLDFFKYIVFALSCLEVIFVLAWEICIQGLKSNPLVICMYHIYIMSGRIYTVGTSVNLIHVLNKRNDHFNHLLGAHILLIEGYNLQNCRGNNFWDPFLLCT